MRPVSDYVRFWCANPTTRLAIEVDELIDDLERIAARRRYMRAAIEEVIVRLEDVKYELLSSAVKE